MDKTPLEIERYWVKGRPYLFTSIVAAPTIDLVAGTGWVLTLALASLLAAGLIFAICAGAAVSVIPAGFQSVGSILIGAAFVFVPFAGVFVAGNTLFRGVDDESPQQKFLFIVSLIAGGFGYMLLRQYWATAQRESSSPPDPTLPHPPQTTPDSPSPGSRPPTP